MEGPSSEICELSCNKITQLKPENVSIYEAHKGTTAWPDASDWRPVFVEGVVISDTGERRQSCFQLDTCSQGLIKNFKNAEQYK